jgi:Ca2+/Na+ antiporter
MTTAQMIGLVGGILGGLIGILCGAVGTCIGIMCAKTPRERAFAIKASIVCWIFALAFVLGIWLIPGFYKLLLVPIYVVALVAGILFIIRRSSQIQSEDSKRAV